VKSPTSTFTISIISNKNLTKTLNIRLPRKLSSKIVAVFRHAENHSSSQEIQTMVTVESELRFLEILIKMILPEKFKVSTKKLPKAMSSAQMTYYREKENLLQSLNLMKTWL